MTENITNTLAPKLTKSRKQKLIKGFTAGALALGVFGVASFSAWTASQTFTVDSSNAEAAAEILEYSLDAGTTWLPFEDGSAVLTPYNFMTESYGDYLNMTPNDDRYAGVLIRNTSTTNAVVMDATNPHSVVFDGDIFTGEIAADDSSAVTPGQVALPTYIGPGEMYHGTNIGLMADARLSPELATKTGTVELKLNFDTSSDNAAGIWIQNQITYDAEDMYIWEATPSGAPYLFSGGNG